MKDKIIDVIKYILREYPYKSELSASRLTKMLYLIDWKSALTHDHQITDAKWVFNHYGPYVDDFMTIASQDADIEVTEDTTVYGGKKKLVQLKNDFKGDLNLDPEDKSLINFVIEATKSKTYEDFLKLVYSTYPVITGKQYSELDLVTSAQKYKVLLSANSAASKV